MSKRWLWSAATAVVTSSNAADAFVLGTNAAAAGRGVVAGDSAAKKPSFLARRTSYASDNPFGVAMMGQAPSLAAACGAATTLSHRTGPWSADAGYIRGSLVGRSGKQGRFWRSGAFFGRGTGERRGGVTHGVLVAQQGDKGVSCHEKAEEAGCSGGKVSRSVAAALRFVREGALPRRLGKTSKSVRARLVGWRRGVSLAFVGMAATLFVMTASAGPASALLERTRLNPDGTPRRLTNMPEEFYQQRENLQEFCQSHPSDRLFDFDDLTTYEEELDKLDMFGDKIKVAYGTREALRMKYSGYLGDLRNGGKTRGLAGALRLGIFGTLVLLVVSTCLNAVAWVFKAFLSMAKEEEVHLYGEEISVDATEKEDDELEETEDDDDFGVDDDDDLEDFAKSGPATPGIESASSPSSPPSSLGDGGDDSGSVSGDAGGEADDDLLDA